MDAKLDFKNTFIDLAISAGGLDTDNGLYTAVVISLFSDRRASSGDVLPDNSNDRRGWWADVYAEIDGDQIGSKLWLLGREKQVSDIIRKAQIYARDALQWLIDDGIARSVSVTAEWYQVGTLGLQIEICRPDGTPFTYRFNNLWEAINGV